MADSILQGELVIHERDFTRLFPQIEGRRVFLIEGPTGSIPSLEEALSDYGFDAVGTGLRLASYHRVENTYLSTFQALGGLGLLLASAGLAAILLRNAFERRRELALLAATGFSRADIERLLIIENLAISGGAVLAGAVTALVSVAPAVLRRGSPLNLLAVLAVLGLVVAIVWLVTRIAARAAVAGPPIEHLRAG
jgi:ABC-type antimicrobial peptide transport system permease subunit